MSGGAHAQGRVFIGVRAIMRHVLCIVDLCTGGNFLVSRFLFTFVGRTLKEQI